MAQLHNPLWGLLTGRAIGAAQGRWWPKFMIFLVRAVNDGTFVRTAPVVKKCMSQRPLQLLLQRQTASPPLWLVLPRPRRRPSP